MGSFRVEFITHPEAQPRAAECFSERRKLAYSGRPNFDEGTGQRPMAELFGQFWHSDSISCVEICQTQFCIILALLQYF